MFATLLRLGEFSQPFKRAQFGLFGGKTKQYGNNVPFSKHKTRRTWLPNVQRKRLPSEVLEGNIRVKVTTRALRTIKKYGGVDNYLTQTKAYKLSHEGMKLRLRIKDAAKEKLKSPEHRREVKAEIAKQVANQPLWQTIEGSLHRKYRKVRDLIPFRGTAGGSLELARSYRIDAAKALGLTDRLASPEETIKYLQQRA